MQNPFFFILGLFQCQLQKDKKKRNYAVIIQSVSFRFFCCCFYSNGHSKCRERMTCLCNSWYMTIKITQKNLSQETISFLLNLLNMTEIKGRFLQIIWNGLVCLFLQSETNTRTMSSLQIYLLCMLI